MKQWISPFKRSRFSERARRFLPLAVLSSFACQNLGDSQGPSLRAQAPDFSSSVKVYLQSNTSSPAYIGEFDRGSCLKDVPTRWAFFVSSALGDSRFDLDLTGAFSEANTISARIGNQPFVVQLSDSLAALESAQLCQKAKGEASITLHQKNPEVAELFKPLMQIAPDCLFEIRSETKGLMCTLRHHTLKEIMLSLEESKRNVSTKWNHQPYLLIRRLTLAQQFLAAIDSDRSLRDTRRICRIMAYSLPNELPLSFQSKLWQEKVCGQEGLDREMALSGLELAVREIETLSRRIDAASHIGIFTLALPPHPSASKDYWITLQPLNNTQLTYDKTSQAVRCSWHPFFATRMEQQLIASELASSSSASAVYCPKTDEILQSKALADTYISSSMASEMEFEISNRQSKKLRLPTGDYQYTITQHNGLFIDETTTSDAILPLSTGSISWKKANSHNIIRNW